MDDFNDEGYREPPKVYIFRDLALGLTIASLALNLALHTTA